MIELFSSVREVLNEACKESGSTPLQEVIGYISFAALIPTLWLFLYALGCR